MEIFTVLAVKKMLVLTVLSFYVNCLYKTLKSREITSISGLTYVVLVVRIAVFLSKPFLYMYIKCVYQKGVNVL